MNSSFFITLISLAIIGAIAYFSAVGFRGAGKIKKVPRNLSNYLSDDLKLFLKKKCVSI